MPGVRNKQQGLAASLFQTSFQVGGALVLAIVTAVVDASGGGRLTTPAATLAAYRPALYLITGVAVFGALVAVAMIRQVRQCVAHVGQFGNAAFKFRDVFQRNRRDWRWNSSSRGLHAGTETIF